jgi:hypothetical protein
MGFNYEQYELAASINNVDNDSWSNANGYNKADLISKIKNAKETVIDRNGKLNLAQAAYDEANGRKCSGCGGRKEPKCHDRCWAKESDKANRANDIRVYTAEIKTANDNIDSWQKELDIIAEEEANKVVDMPTSSTPSTPTNTEANSSSTNPVGGKKPEITRPQDSPVSSVGVSKSNTMLYVGIGAGILILGIVTIILIKRNK